MHFGFALVSWNIDLWDIDILVTYLDFLVGHVGYRYPNKHFVYLQDVFKTSTWHAFKMPSA